MAYKRGIKRKETTPPSKQPPRKRRLILEDEEEGSLDYDVNVGPQLPEDGNLSEEIEALFGDDDWDEDGNKKESLLNVEEEEEVGRLVNNLAGEFEGVANVEEVDDVHEVIEIVDVQAGEGGRNGREEEEGERCEGEGQFVDDVGADSAEPPREPEFVQPEYVTSVIPPMVLKTYLDEHEHFQSKITVRSSLIGRMREFRIVLRTSGLYDKFKNSIFGHFLDLPEEPSFPTRLVHNILLRRVLCNKEKEAWFNFNGVPVRFGLQEFALMTKLRCQAYPSVQWEAAIKERGREMWEYISTAWEDGKARAVTASRLLSLIENEEVPERYKFGLAMAWFVHSILCAKDKKAGIEELLVCLAYLPNEFAKYPWGRKSFELTIEYLTKPMADRAASKAKDGPNYNLYGFPWAFVGWVFEAIPSLRPRDFPKERSMPRMHRWITEKNERDSLRLFENVAKPVVHPFIDPIDAEREDETFQNIEPFVDGADEVIDHLVVILEGASSIVGGDRVTVFRNCPRTPPREVIDEGKVGEEFVSGGVGRCETQVGDEIGGRAGRFTGGLFSGRGLFEVGESSRRREQENVEPSVCSCKCHDCLQWRQGLDQKLDAIQLSLANLVASSSKKKQQQQRPKRNILLSKMLQAKKNKGKKKMTAARMARERAQVRLQNLGRLPVTLYKALDIHKKAEFDAFLEEKKEQKTAFLCHDFNYLDFLDFLDVKEWMWDSFMDEYLALMRVRHKAYPRHYDSSDLILDLSFLTNMCVRYGAAKEEARGFDVGLDKYLAAYKFEDTFLDYARGKSPYPGGRKWDGVKRLFAVYNIESTHYVTCVFYLEEARIDVYDCNIGLYNEDRFDSIMGPIMYMFPIYIRQSGKFNHLPPEIQSMEMWPYERIQGLPRNLTGTACGAYAIMFLEHLLSNTPMEYFCDNVIEDCLVKFAVDIFHGKLVP